MEMMEILLGSPEWVFSEGHHSIKFTEYAQSVISPIEDFNENFSYTFWAKPTSSHEIDVSTTSGYGGLSGQKYLLYPKNALSYGSGIGLSLGINGISIYEHRNSNLHCTSSVEQNLSGWNFYSIVSISNQVKIYINGAHIQDALYRSEKLLIVQPVLHKDIRPQN